MDGGGTVLQQHHLCCRQRYLYILKQYILFYLYIMENESSVVKNNWSVKAVVVKDFQNWPCFPLRVLCAALRHISLVGNSRAIVTVSTDGCYLCSLCPVQEPWNRENTLFPSSFSYQVGAWSDGMSSCRCTFFPVFVFLCFALAFHSFTDRSRRVDTYSNSLTVQRRWEWDIHPIIHGSLSV